MRAAYLRSFGIPLACALGAAAWGAHVLGPRGVIVAALACSLPMVLLLAGLRLDTSRLRAALGGRALPRAATMRWGRVLLVHSHHEARLAARGKELRVRGRLFCAGCYGIVAGTLAGDAAAGLYLWSGFGRDTTALLAALLPLAFLPIIARYTIAKHMSAGLRVLANGFLAAGCWLLLLLADAWLASATTNLALLAGFGLVALGREYVARAENQALIPGRVVVRP